MLQSVVSSAYQPGALADPTGFLREQVQDDQSATRYQESRPIPTQVPRLARCPQVHRGIRSRGKDRQWRYYQGHQAGHPRRKSSNDQRIEFQVEVLRHQGRRSEDSDHGFSKVRFRLHFFPQRHDKRWFCKSKLTLSATHLRLKTLRLNMSTFDEEISLVSPDTHPEPRLENYRSKCPRSSFSHHAFTNCQDVKVSSIWRRGTGRDTWI